MSKERFFWTHGSYERERHGFYWRRWFYFGKDICISYDFYLFGRHAGIDIGRGSRSIKFFVGVPLVFNLWLKFGGILPHGERREVALKFHSGAAWWTLWLNPDEWESKTPKWRQGNFNPMDFFFGRHSYTSVLVEERNITVPMPEKVYFAKAKLHDDYWSRPRWPFTKHIRRCTIDMPDGIPHEGKGENSWDCGTDATFGITLAADSIPEAVGSAIGSMLKTRIKYGGWKDWKWERKHPDGCEIKENAGEGHSFMYGCDKYFASIGMSPQRGV